MCAPVPTFGCNIENCLGCSSENRCTKCIQGYSLSGDNSCSPMLYNEPNCLHFGDNGTCTLCTFPYAVQENGTCSLMSFACNVENCLFCSSINSCSACQYGYYHLKKYSFTLRREVSTCSDDFSIFPQSQLTSLNCLQKGILKENGILNSELVAGCISCTENFVNIGGFCVAKLASYECNV